MMQRKEDLLKESRERALEEVKALTVYGQDNPYERILEKANPEDDSWMEQYGLPVTEMERKMMRFWFQVPKEKLEAMGNVIAEAFLHGFISQSRDRRGRRRVRFFYQIGQEALAKETVRALKEKGLLPVITRPKGLSGESRKQEVHLSDEGLFEMECAAYGEAMRCFEKELKDTCGMIGIDQFGEEASYEAPSQGEDGFSEKERELSARLSAAKAGQEAEWIRPSEISFCKAAFPNMLVGDRFEQIFQDFYDLNMQRSEPFERYQQALIDGLDICEYVEMKGFGGNETDLRIHLGELRNPEKETKFLNCGGDLNIPYGEVFTTPRLGGTAGRLHVEEICLKGIFYHGLKIDFQDGRVTDADCLEGKKHVTENLLYPHENITMGEFAVGTNTRAYALAEKYGIGPRMPILLYEKMGPHIAIGDPCFARSEEAPIYNMFDQKEMVCRANEVTEMVCRADEVTEMVCRVNEAAERSCEKERVYYEKHIDITLPYHQVEYLRGIRPDGSMLYFIRKGRFVLEGTEGLNEGFSCFKERNEEKQ